MREDDVVEGGVMQGGLMLLVVIKDVSMETRVVDGDGIQEGVMKGESMESEVEVKLESDTQPKIDLLRELNVVLGWLEIMELIYLSFEGYYHPFDL
jgi:hypothetical protein